MQIWKHKDKHKNNKNKGYKPNLNAPTAAKHVQW